MQRPFFHLWAFSQILFSLQPAEDELLSAYYAGRQALQNEGAFRAAPAASAAGTLIGFCFVQCGLDRLPFGTTAFHLAVKRGVMTIMNKQADASKSGCVGFLLR